MGSIKIQISKLESMQHYYFERAISNLSTKSKKKNQHAKQSSKLNSLGICTDNWNRQKLG